MKRKVKSLIVFCDLRKASFMGMTGKEALDLCSSLVDYGCYIAEQFGIQAEGITAMIPEGSATSLSVKTKYFSDTMLQIISDELESVEAVGVLEGLGGASVIPEDLKKICDEKFKTILPFSSFFPTSKAGDDFRQEMLRQKEDLNKKKARKPQQLMRGGRRK